MTDPSLGIAKGGDLEWHLRNGASDVFSVWETINPQGSGATPTVQVPSLRAMAAACKTGAERSPSVWMSVRSSNLGPGIDRSDFQVRDARRSREKFHAVFPDYGAWELRQHHRSVADDACRDDVKVEERQTHHHHDGVSPPRATWGAPPADVWREDGMPSPQVALLDAGVPVAIERRP